MKHSSSCLICYIHFANIIHLDFQEKLVAGAKLIHLSFDQIITLNCNDPRCTVFTVRLLLPGSLKTGQSDHSMILTVNNSKILGFNCCFSSTRDWFNQLWLKFIVLVLQSDWPVLFK